MSTEAEKAAQRRWKQRNRDRVRAQGRAYQKRIYADPARRTALLKYQRTRRREQPERERVYRKRYREKYQELLRARDRARSKKAYTTNAEYRKRKLLQAAGYRRRHPERVRESRKRYYQIKKNDMAFIANNRVRGAIYRMLFRENMAERRRLKLLLLKRDSQLYRTFCNKKVKLQQRYTNNHREKVLLKKRECAKRQRDNLLDGYIRTRLMCQSPSTDLIEAKRKVIQFRRLIKVRTI